MRQLIVPALLALCAGASQGAEVGITVSMATPGALEVRYDLPPGCARLDFSNAGIVPPAAAAMRADWRALDGCATLDAQGVVVQDASCRSVRFHVPASTANLDRVYPWALPFDQGMFSHTSAFAVNDSCGATSWQFAAPGGTVVVDGKAEAGKATRAAGTPNMHYAPVVFMQTVGGGRVHIDAAIAPETARFFQDTTGQLFRHYAAAYPGIAFAPPYTVAIAAQDANNYGGDVANRTTMRLTIPVSANKEQRDNVQRFLGHETSHLLQHELTRDTWNADANAIMEGGADFMSWAAAVRLGWIDRPAAAAKAGESINACLLELKGKNWQQVTDRQWGDVPYKCGMALHLMGLSGRAVPARPELVLRDYYAAIASGAQTDFAQALECGTSNTCKATWLPRALGSKEPFVDVMAAFGAQTGLLTSAPVWTPETVRLVGYERFAQLMAQDCGGEISFMQYANAVGIAKVKACKTLREGMIVKLAGDKNMFTELDGLRGMIASCQTSGKTRLGLKDGSAIELACARTMVDLPILYTVDGERLFARLGM